MPQERLPAVTLDDLRNAEGKEIGVSQWREIAQATIDKFADATDDHQFIHIDPERAARETPFGGTIAHGFLTLSLLSAFSYEVLPPLESAAAGVNYGFDQIRFVAPVKAGARIRGRFKLDALTIRPSGWIQMTYAVTVEIEGSIKPALTARWLTLTVIDRSEAAA